MTDRPRVFIEDQFPIEELGIETRRERGASSALPPLLYLHVWWARRPLTVSRAAVLGSLLPGDFDADRFKRICGIKEDVVAVRKRLDEGHCRQIQLTMQCQELQWSVLGSDWRL